MPQTRFFDTLDSDKQNAQKAEEWLRDIEVICHKLLNEGESKGTTLPIKVAIIDTGVDAKHPELSGKIGRDKPFRDIAEFRDGKGITNHTFPRGEDEAPHGTHVAALLNRIAPLALIYIARVGFGSGELEPDYVAAVCMSLAIFMDQKSDHFRQ
jgi:subtilisin family serine protease